MGTGKPSIPPSRGDNCIRSQYVMNYRGFTQGNRRYTVLLKLPDVTWHISRILPTASLV